LIFLIRSLLHYGQRCIEVPSDQLLPVAFRAIVQIYKIRKQPNDKDRQNYADYHHSYAHLDLKTGPC
jgi:hypothetical protein